MQEKEEKLIIDLSCSGGIADIAYPEEEDGIITHPEFQVLGGDTQCADGFVNPLIYPGIAIPDNDDKTDIGTGDFYVAAQVDNSLYKVYLLSHSDSNIYELESFTDTSLTLKHSVTGKVGRDLEMYTVNGEKRIFYAYTDDVAGTGDIGIWDMDATYNDTWLSGSCSGGSTTGSNGLVMRVADNGYMYVLDGAMVHKIDGTIDGGTSGTATMNVLVFPATFQLIDALDLRGALWITLMQSNRDLREDQTEMYSVQGGVYVWDRESTRISIQDFIPIQGAREIRNIFAFRGVPACFTLSVDGFTELRIYNGNEFKTVRKMGRDAYPNIQDGVVVIGDRIVWYGNDGVIYVYGRTTIEGADSLYKIGRIYRGEGADATFIKKAGAFIRVGGDEKESYYLSYETDGGEYFKRWKSYDPNSLTNISDGHYSLVKMIPKLSRIKSITVFTPSIQGIDLTDKSTKIDIDVYINQSTEYIKSLHVTNKDLARGYAFFPLDIANVNSIQIRTRILASYAKVMYAEVVYTYSRKLI